MASRDRLVADIEFGDDDCRKIFEETIKGVRYLDHTMGLQYRRLAKDSVIAQVLVTESLLQPFGLLHGGINVAIAESCCSIGGFLNIPNPIENRMTAVGLEINANHIRPARLGDLVICTSKPEHIGRQHQIWSARLTVGSALTSIVRCTLAIVQHARL